MHLPGTIASLAQSPKTDGVKAAPKKRLQRERIINFYVQEMKYIEISIEKVKNCDVGLRIYEADKDNACAVRIIEEGNGLFRMLYDDEHTRWISLSEDAAYVKDWRKYQLISGIEDKGNGVLSRQRSISLP